MSRPRSLAIATSAAVAVGAVLRRTGLWSDGRVLPVLDTKGRPVAGSLAEKVFLDVNGTRQGVILRSRDVTQPVLLFLHGGMPEYVLTERYPTGVEDLFTVAWWEQRGAGLSFDPRLPRASLTAEQLVADTLAVTDHLCERFGVDKVYLMAHSGGTFVGLQAAARSPERFHAYIGVAQMVDQRRSEARAYEHMLRRYEELGDERMVRRLRRAPATVADGTPRAYLRVRDTAMHRLGVGTTRDMRSVLTGIVWPSLRSPQYTPAEKVRTWRAKVASSVSALWDEALATDLGETVPALDVPLYLFHGIHDHTCSYDLARAYLETVQAPAKGFYTFRESAHSPFLEEPDRARRILREDVLAGTTHLADGA
ncbi:alpha/beta fold hydrolase [Actinotalea sp. Marseille-Q4924]|uniref:alpha/beta fold hydrolase n=1 Tax=Actinotalea sp. Marseille-Q4924 TaxID=2866571 RepID=UPI001CE40361|nr:alpha/beta hydrolase [Actinotalea sp. Marseille-Q4924]